MNWYRLLKLAFSRTKSQRLTMSLSRQIFEFIKAHVQKDGGCELKVDDNCSLYLQVNHSEDAPFLKQNFYIDAGGTYIKKDSFLSLVPPSMQFIISLNKDFSELDFPKLYYDLYISIRHELGHYWKYLDPNYNLEENELTGGRELILRYRNWKDYILVDQELDAYVRGLIFSAQKQRKPFSVLLNENLTYLLFENDESVKQNVLSSTIGPEVSVILEEIKSKATEKVKQLYPMSRIT